ncbi:hypothetical protein [Halobacillus sp. BBL2006]|uniref:hypothetical protein n=1 Tax=Halobacillus sp. BBL2006 TaxID=1543706 RepID=UPI000541D332|nr:hypothetical protein [Halobacillus sp. BBL2006]KHE68889.1 hypothetical protein LD39_13710 [Halobacillus sp. BBL2006]
MYDKQLIEKIVAEVLKEKNVFQNKNKPVLHVVQANKSKDNAIINLETNWLLEWVDLDHLDESETISQAVFPQVDQDLFVKSAMGITDTPESHWFAKLMSSGVAIHFILDRSMEWIHTQPEKIPAPYLGKMRNYEKELRSYHVSILKEDEVLTPPNNKNGSPFYFDGKLLTQDEITRWPYSDIHISQKTIITPLARDTARDANITISIEEL